MKKQLNFLTVAALVVAAVFIALPVMADTMVTGSVGSSYDILADDGMVYIIAETEKGEELAAMVGETVQVYGTVEEAEGEKFITVNSFTVVTKPQ
jgi:hypothetical protein